MRQVTITVEETRYSQFLQHLRSLKYVRVSDDLGQPNASVTEKETALLSKIRGAIPASVVRRYRQLAAKQAKGSIGEKEREEMLLLTDFMEEKSAERVGWLAELSQIRQTPLVELAKQLHLRDFHA